jgi:hypothetical protein
MESSELEGKKKGLDPAKIPSMRYIEAGTPVAFPSESTSHVASAFTSGVKPK